MTGDILVKMDFRVGEHYQRGQRYWTVENWQHSAEVLTSAEFRFQNLFGGNTQLCKSDFISFINPINYPL